MKFQDFFKGSAIQILTETEFTLQLILMFLGVSLVFAIYIFIIYRYSSKSSFYSPNFGKTLVGMAVLTTGIILAMQGSLVVSLGMVGALSIVRFRNAVKAPLDLLFLFWSISTGIICGTGLFNIALVSAIVMTIVVLGLDYIPVGKASYILTINGTDVFDEDILLRNIKQYSKNIHVRTRSIYNNQQELLLELHTKDSKNLIKACSETNGVTSSSLIYHDGEVRF